MFQVLVVDDDKSTRYLMREILEMENYTVFTAHSGDTALSIMANKHIDIVIVDIMMPNMDGYEFTKLVRESNQTLPILMVSAKQLTEDRKKGFLAGIDDYMSKPIDPEEFILRLKSLLRRSLLPSESMLTVGDVKLEYTNYTVTKGDEVIELPQKEFLLLYKLLSQAGKIFTRIQLMDEIWGMDCDTGWETVTVHIGRLRKRFESYDDFEIESIRGLGYKAVIKK